MSDTPVPTLTVREIIDEYAMEAKRVVHLDEEYTLLLDQVDRTPRDDGSVQSINVQITTQKHDPSHVLSTVSVSISIDAVLEAKRQEMAKARENLDAIHSALVDRLREREAFDPREATIEPEMPSVSDAPLPLVGAGRLGATAASPFRSDVGPLRG